ncbi:MAG: helix-turn-helix transcriptional regulator [Coriobacteriales bacterium]|nr:helix-turn-helix transcriptional regulator [Coriobacteriales bacterium]
MQQQTAMSVVKKGVRSIGFPLLGMACFWAFMRYQNFFMILYPRNQIMNFGSISLPLQTPFLIALFLLIFIGINLWFKIEDFLDHERIISTLLSFIGSAGVILAIAMRNGFFEQSSGSWYICEWASAFMVAFGYLLALLMWANFFSKKFGAQEIIVIAASYVLSLLMFQTTGYAETIWEVAITALVPFGSAICWFFAETPASDNSASSKRSLSLRLLANPTLLLFIAFLLTGSIIRGVFDIIGPSPSIRHTLSIPIACSLLAICCIYVFINRNNKDVGTPSLVLGCWIGFSVLFIFGVFLLYTQDFIDLGGSTAVIARSMLGLLFWMLLCDYAYRSDVPYVPLFLICEAIVEGLSWLTSYVIVPLLATGYLGNGAASPHTLVLISIFGLVAIITVACGMIMVFVGRHNMSIPANDWIPSGSQHTTQPVPPAPETTPSTAVSDENRIENALIDLYNLTPREATVAATYARGFSLAKVSEALGITTAAAQSQIKSAYRKLGIHTKDQLIEITNSLKD